MTNKSKNQGTIIYIHGYQSDVKSGKIPKLKEKFGADFQILTRSYSPDPDIVMQQVDDFINQATSNNLIFIGSSLGGFYSFYSCLKYGGRAFIMNPAPQPDIGLKEKTSDKTGVKTTFRGAPYDFKDIYLDKLEKLTQEIITKIEIAPSLTDKIDVFINRDDEVIPQEAFSWYLDRFKNDGNIHFFEEGGHQVENVDEVFGEIRRLMDIKLG